MKSSAASPEDGKSLVAEAGPTGRGGTGSAGGTAFCRPPRWKSLALWGAGIALAVLAGDVLSQVTTAGSFRYPIRDASTGQKTAEITGDSASDTADGAIRITGLRLAIFGLDGRTNALVAAADCVYKLDAQTAVSDSDVRVENGSIVVTGRGFVWRAKDKVVKINSQARIEIGETLDLGSYVAAPDKQGE